MGLSGLNYYDIAQQEDHTEHAEEDEVISDDTRSITFIIILLIRDWRERDDPDGYSFLDSAASGCEHVTTRLTSMCDSCIASEQVEESRHMSGAPDDHEPLIGMYDAYTTDKESFQHRFGEILTSRTRIMHEINNICVNTSTTFTNITLRETNHMNIAIASITDHGDTNLTTHCIDIQIKRDLMMLHTTNVFNIIKRTIISRIAMLIPMIDRVLVDDYLTYDEMVSFLTIPVIMDDVGPYIARIRQLL